MAFYLLNPKNGLNLERYNRDYKYDAKDKIAKISAPFLYEKDFSYKQVLKPFDYSITNKIYIGNHDIDRIEEYLFKKETHDLIKSGKKKRGKLSAKLGVLSMMSRS